MVIPIVKYCHFQFQDRHFLRCCVTGSLNLEWVLYIDDVEVGRFLDEETNILLPSGEHVAFSWPNIVKIYNNLLPKAQTNG